jgi:hypothetical protein
MARNGIPKDREVCSFESFLVNSNEKKVLEIYQEDYRGEGQKVFKILFFQVKL